MPRLAAAAAIVAVLALPAFANAAERPSDLDELVELALSRDPSARATELDADAARARAAGARQPVSPELMVGIDSWGAPMDDPDPTMWMGGIRQMLPGFGQLRARSNRFSVDAKRAEVEGDVIAADLRLRLWQASARIEALQQEIELIDEQLRESDSLRKVAFSRYRSVPGVGAPARSMPSGESMKADSMDDATSSVTPPRVEGRASTGGGGMAGMGGGGSSMTSTRARVPGMEGGMDDGASPMAGGGMNEDGSLPGLLRLDVAVERLRAERAGLDARLTGETAVLALFVGEDAAKTVTVSPARFRGTPPASVPERALAEIDRDAAEADLTVARTRRRPDVMWSVAMRAMPPHGEPAGVDASIGIAIPIGGGLAREVLASRRNVEAAEARKAAIERDLAAAIASGRAAVESARARRVALEEKVLPRAESSYAASRRVYASGRGEIGDALLAWDALITARREWVTARRDEELRTAELARVEGR